ncbi:tripartite tricarboxylate transporter permease [Campylobacter fetus]|uniref:tripartite tricarboxylate transporter permease n=1 Tax=Campylobacter TaxID=194 RepID=UPI000068B381|nr:MULTISPECIES: tripartite tricarboxylate transporter permease [Campylobacter]OCS23306.1 hypothetical protein CFVI97532_00580 [Campylobacter fetus subsp. venerealis cfvi97/532]OCS25615.1 hypothetical protein CFVB10_07460 [Campylobacter fetus subsp. venerealis cfvB10]OCS30673.1 hypothetical protein CFVCCUG33900_00885 [Campylobacter fetus subsp. venerealis LMG 6570 = CCUG 33900]OCS41442.1 hypothetical protein CFVI02298_06905 [Campylobacter fetus subsp. venerealis cfvi02/298]EJC3759762.1 tripart
MLCGLYYGAEFGGRILSIPLNVLGDAGAVFTTLDGYRMAKNGFADPALAISGIASFISGSIAVIGLTFFTSILSSIAIRIKSLTGVIIGILIAVVGVDSTTGILRFTFNEPEL